MGLQTNNDQRKLTSKPTHLYIETDLTETTHHRNHTPHKPCTTETIHHSNHILQKLYTTASTHHRKHSPEKAQIRHSDTCALTEQPKQSYHTRHKILAGKTADRHSSTISWNPFTNYLKDNARPTPSITCKTGIDTENTTITPEIQSPTRNSTPTTLHNT